MIVQSGNLKELPNVSGYMVRNFQVLGHKLLWLCLCKVSDDGISYREVNIYLEQPRFRSANFICAEHFPALRQLNINSTKSSQIDIPDGIDILFCNGDHISYGCDGGVYLIADCLLHSD